ncbi:hypothetical protein HID58_056797 [Brassica napus]|uniref:Cytochrome P450 n=1 Tax=Brassica napus TaxID=3708 RepID=A0ABQ8AQA0_BRANA|nr:hypothetical protein HID58_056797 [Brassica napus]
MKECEDKEILILKSSCLILLHVNNIDLSLLNKPFGLSLPKKESSHESSPLTFKLPPSPWRLPVIGNLHQLSRNPHRSLGSLSLRYGPLMLLHFGRVPILVVSSADTAHEVMKTHDEFLNGGRNLAFSPYGEYWRHVKSICVQNLLSSKTVRSFENIRKEEINVMMDKLEKASSSLSRKYSSDERKDYSNNLVRRYMEILGAFPIGEYIPSLAWVTKVRGFDRKVDKLKNEIDSFLEKVVQEHVDADEDQLYFVDIYCHQVKGIRRHHSSLTEPV